ncbi:hypothetical protein UA40_12520 [Photobacterium kishitanii]|nr:hypothetical protein UA40_12520 [Photobacterium kishitanii]
MESSNISKKKITIVYIAVFLMKKKINEEEKSILLTVLDCADENGGLILTLRYFDDVSFLCVNGEIFKVNKKFVSELLRSKLYVSKSINIKYIDKIDNEDLLGNLKVIKRNSRIWYVAIFHFILLIAFSIGYLWLF